MSDWERGFFADQKHIEVDGMRVDIYWYRNDGSTQIMPEGHMEGCDQYVWAGINGWLDRIVNPHRWCSAEREILYLARRAVRQHRAHETTPHGRTRAGWEALTAPSASKED